MSKLIWFNSTFQISCAVILHSISICWIPIRHLSRKYIFNGIEVVRLEQILSSFFLLQIFGVNSYKFYTITVIYLWYIYANDRITIYQPNNPYIDSTCKSFTKHTSFWDHQVREALLNLLGTWIREINNELFSNYTIIVMYNLRLPYDYMLQ